MNYLDHVEATARAVPDRVAVRAGDDQWTYADLLQDVRSAANALAAAGVQSGDEVLVVLPNTYDFVTAALGALTRQAVLVPADTRFGRREVGSLLGQVNPEAAVVTERTKEVLEAGATVADTTPPTTFVAEDPPSDGESIDERDTQRWRDALAAADGQYRFPETLGEREAVILHTSGSTGEPKAVRHTHANLIAISDASAISYEVRPGDVFLAVMPLYHCTGLGTILGPTLKVGGELLLHENWDPEGTLDAIGDRDVAVFSGVPAMYRDLLDTAADRDVDASSLHTGIIGGAGVTARLVGQSEALLGCQVLNGWGMTETFAGGVWENRHGERRLPSVGSPTGRLFEAKTIDRETGEECPPGEPGELLVRGEAMMTGYLDHDAEWTGEWLHTGDYAVIEDGFVTILDRVDDTIVTGGENVFPAEIETVIEELDGVREAVVVGKPDERKGEKPVAFISRQAETQHEVDETVVDEQAADEQRVDEQTVKDHVLAELAPYKHPRSVYFVTELPQNSSGKVDRDSLAERL